jgi:hypothetical protein
LDNLVSASDRCSLDEETRNGNSLGGCDDAPLPLQKLIGSVVREFAKDHSIPEELHSPAYDVLREFSMTSYQIGEVFNRFFALDVDPDNYDLREATCAWFVENFEGMEDFTPEGFPRTLQSDEDLTNQPIYYAAIAFAAMSVCVVTCTCVVTYFQRKRHVIRLAQIEFLSVVLLGLMMVSVGSVLIAVPATNGICVVSIWMVNIGYTFEVVPIVVKMAAIFRMMRAAEKMEHLEFTRKSLFTAMLVPTLVVGVFLITWSVLDPPRQELEYNLLPEDQKTEGGDFVIETTPYCSSEWNTWYWAAVGWHFLLLVTATVQAFQARAVIRKLADENQTLAFMIYSHFVFVCCRVATYWFDDSFSFSSRALARSIVYSVDTIFTVFIYFVPKFLDQSQSTRDNILTRDGEHKTKAAQTKSEKEFDHLAKMSHVDGDIGLGDEGRSLDVFEYDSDDEQTKQETAPKKEKFVAFNRRQSFGDDQPEQATGYVHEEEAEHPGYGSSDDEDDHPGYE